MSGADGVVFADLINRAIAATARPNSRRQPSRGIVQIIAILKGRVREQVSRQDGRGMEGYRQVVYHHDADRGDGTCGG